MEGSLAGADAAPEIGSVVDLRIEPPTAAPRGRVEGLAFRPLLFLRPRDVLAHQWRRIIRTLRERGQDRRIVRRIAKADREIARPSLVAYAADCAAFHPFFELCFGPAEKRHEIGVVQSVPHIEIRLARDLRKAIPRTDQLAIVAAVDAIADQRTQFLGNRAGMLDG